MRYSNIVLSTLFCLACSSTVHADILDLQPFNGGQSAASQIFTDPPQGAVISFDDFTVTGNGWDITQVTAFGVENVVGRVPNNLAVTLAFLTAPDVTTIGTTYAGTEINSNLVFTEPIHLDPGAYFITAYVTRPLNPGGQWFFGESTPVSGTPFYQQNPDGGLGVGTAPYQFNLANDLAFEIDGTMTAAATPEPGSVTLLIGMGCIGASLLVRRRKQANKGLRGKNLEG